MNGLLIETLVLKLQRSDSMINYQSAFAAFAVAYAKQALPMDDANWDVWQSPDHNATTAEILEHFDGSTVELPEDVCGLLNVPLGTSYALGADRIRAFAGPSAAGRQAINA